MTQPPQDSPAPLQPDPLRRLAAQADLQGRREEQASLELWVSLRDLLRSKRPEAALTALERWRAAQAAGGEKDEKEEEEPLSATAQELSAALADPALPAALQALAGVKRWHTLQEAEGNLASALAHPLTRAEAQNLLGVLAAEAGEAQAAETAFAAALEADPGHYRALTNRAGLAAERGEWAAAEADLRRALALEPQHHAAHQNLAVVLRQQGKHAESVRALRKAQRLDYRRSGTRSSDQARRELSALPRVPRLLWSLLGLGLLAGLCWLAGVGAGC